MNDYPKPTCTLLNMLPGGCTVCPGSLDSTLSGIHVDFYIAVGHEASFYTKQ